MIGKSSVIIPDISFNHRSTPETAYHPEKRSKEREKWMNKLYEHQFYC